VRSNVFRAAIFSIVVLLATGQNVGLLCGLWCHSSRWTAHTCEHQTQTKSPDVAANDDCTGNSNAIVFVRADARRNASAPDVQGAVPVPRFAFTPRPADAPLGFELACRPLLELRPLVLALRI
jgi:hypothetical protein